MPSRMDAVMRHVHRTVLLRDSREMTDAQLLNAFVLRRDETAFESIVRRHGPMVMGVCGRVLRNQHDAEDAFQATFLILVRKARSIVPRDMLGNWLHGVAYRTAMKARAAIGKRGAKEKLALPAVPRSAEEIWQDVQPLLDQELDRLPQKYRLPILLCDLGGKKGVTPYGLRHRYGLMGIKNGVNLKLLSLCMGHARTQMTEHYIAEAGLTAQVQAAAFQVAYGHEHPSPK